MPKSHFFQIWNLLPPATLHRDEDRESPPKCINTGASFESTQGTHDATQQFCCPRQYAVHTEVARAGMGTPTALAGCLVLSD